METTNDTSTGIAHMQAVTISRQYGSGGGEIAARLASKLGWKLVDHEAVIQVAQELGISASDAEVQDEHVESLGMRLLNGLSLIQPPLSNAIQIVPLSDDLIYHEALRKVIKAALIPGHVVIVGRGSQMLFKERRDILHVRIVAPLEQRISYVMRREGLNHEDAQARVNYKDNGRVRYLQMHYHQNPADPQLYDLVINTAVLSLDNAVQLILTALEQKASRLSVPSTELGPGAGLPQYPGRSEDFRVTKNDAQAEAQ